MNYRIVRITNLYPEFLKAYYQRFPEIIKENHHEQYHHLIQHSFDSTITTSKQLTLLGNESHVIFSNAYPLQNQWATENSIAASGKELLLEQIENIRPDVLWIDDVQLIDANWIRLVRGRVPCLKIVTAEICAPYNVKHVRELGRLSFLFTCTPCLKKDFENQQLKTYLIYHAFEKKVLEVLDQNNHYEENDLVFTGSLYTGNGFHAERIRYLEKILSAGLPLKVFGNRESSRKILVKAAAYYGMRATKNILGERNVRKISYLNRFNAFGNTPVKFYSKNLIKNMAPPVYGVDQLKLLKNAKICFNIHGEIAQNCAGNLRLFEATGVGTCLITDWKENLPELFDINKEIVTYKSEAECIDKMRWLLENPKITKEIAQAGQLRTIKDHSIENQAKLIHEIINVNLY